MKWEKLNLKSYVICKKSFGKLYMNGTVKEFQLSSSNRKFQVVFASRNSYLTENGRWLPLLCVCRWSDIRKFNTFFIYRIIHAVSTVSLSSPKKLYCSASFSYKNFQLNRSKIDSSSKVLERLLLFTSFFFLLPPPYLFAFVSAGTKSGKIKVKWANHLTTGSLIKFWLTHFVAKAENTVSIYNSF